MKPDPTDAPLKLPDPGALITHYDSKRDILIMTVSNPGPAVSVDVDGEFWVRVVPQAREIVGVEIEDFEGLFLRSHPELTAVWQRSGRLAQADGRAREQSERLVHQVMGLLGHILAGRPNALVLSG